MPLECSKDLEKAIHVGICTVVLQLPEPVPKDLYHSVRLRRDARCVASVP